MKQDKNGHRKSNLTDEQLLKAVEECDDMSASDIAHYMGGYDRSTISRHLKQLERDELVTHRDVRGAGGMLALWSLTGKQRCPECNEFLKYTGIVWACPACENDKFEYCDKSFDSTSEVCKRCAVAVECYEASINGT